MKLYERISFSEADSMYILGDIIDKGEQSLDLLDFICKHSNMHCIMGNHEYAFLNYYNSVIRSSEEFDEAEILSYLQRYFPFEDRRITWEIVDYLENLSCYIETENFICVHAGLQLDKNNTILPLEQQKPEYMLFDRSFSNAIVKNPFGKPILFGHTPCSYDNNTGKFIKDPDIISSNIKDYSRIRLDNGSQLTRLLGVLRIEDMAEIYVTE